MGNGFIASLSYQNLSQIKKKLKANFAAQSGSWDVTLSQHNLKLTPRALRCLRSFGVFCIYITIKRNTRSCSIIQFCINFACTPTPFHETRLSIFITKKNLARITSRAIRKKLVLSRCRHLKKLSRTPLRDPSLKAGENRQCPFFLSREKCDKVDSGSRWNFFSFACKLL